MSTTEFQSPSGDSLFSDESLRFLDKPELEYRFNPLAGIRCFLTKSAKTPLPLPAEQVSIP